MLAGHTSSSLLPRTAIETPINSFMALVNLSLLLLLFLWLMLLSVVSVHFAHGLYLDQTLLAGRWHSLASLAAFFNTEFSYQGQIGVT